MKKLKNTLYNKIDFSITSIFTITILLLTGCMNDMAIEKAKNNSEYILNNLSKEGKWLRILTGCKYRLLI